MEGRELTDRYRLEKVLKSTPATTVMAAVEAASGRPVVIKLVHPRSAVGLDVARSRFAHWAATVRALSQPAFPAILEAGFDAEGSAFLVVERLSGRSFETAPPAPGRAAALLAGVGEALALLARRGLAHGNLAADNLWLAPAPQGGEEVKLLGLGTAPFRSGDFGEAAIAGDAAALADLRQRFARADAIAAEAAAAEAAAAGSAALDGEPEEEVLSPVDEDALHAPPEPPPAPVEPAAAALPPPKPADWTSAKLASETDGELFWKISTGRGAMPPWKHLPDNQRWQLVNYIRSLQKK
jgi:serine/threonine protein kinase